MKQAWQLELDRIINFLNTADESQSKKLWHVLSALRGPDSDNIADKAATTCVIRHTVGLTRDELAIILPDDKYKLEQRLAQFPLFNDFVGRRELQRWSHFGTHAYNAFRDLGLQWEKVNEPNTAPFDTTGLYKETLEHVRRQKCGDGSSNS